MKHLMISFNVFVLYLFFGTSSFAQYSVQLKTPSYGDIRVFEPYSLSLKVNHIQMVPLKDKKPFFCALEDRIEKRSAIPFRFRLGSLDYVNILENKK
jgi:hypothetical protein